MSRSRLLSGKVPKKSGSELDSSRYEFLDIANAEPDLGTPNFDGAMLISNSDGSRFWTDNIRIDLTGNIAVGTISTADGSTPVTFVDNVLVEDDLTVQGALFSPIVTTQTINTIDSSNLRIESGLIVEGDLVVQGTTTTINSTTLAIEDKNIELAKGATTAGEADGAGITVLGPETPASLIYDAVTDSWTFNKDIRADLIGNVTGDIFTNRIESPDSSEITVNSSVSVDGDLRVNNDINAGGTVYAERVFVRDTIVGTFEGAITGPEATGLFQQLITSGIDSIDSSPIRFIPGILVESDLTVENNIYADQDITAQRNITAENFYGTFRGNVNVDFGVSDFNDIRIKGLLIGDVLNAISAGNLQGDILAPNGIKILENGTDGTDATFTGSVTGDVFTNRIDSPDSSEITINTSVSVDGDLRVSNDINAQGTVYAERVFVRDTIIGTFEGAITGPEATGLFQQLITNGIDSLDSSPIRFIPGIIVESDVTVENNLYVDQDITAQRNITAERFYGTLIGNVSIDSGISEFNDIRIKGILVGDVLTAISAGNLQGDILAPNGVKVLENGTDGTDATFTGSVTGDVFTNRIDSPDSSEITINSSVSVDGDLRVNNDINAGGTVYAERVFVRDTIIGTFEGAITGPEATGLFQQLITNGIDSLDSSPIRFIPGIIVESDLTVENNGYFQNDLTVSRDVTAQRFIGFLQGQVSDISNHSIGELSDVDITTLPLNNQTLVWNTLQNKFVPGDSFSQADFDTAFGNKSVGDLSDVDTTTTPPTDGQALIWDDISSKFVPGQPIGVSDNVEFSSITADIITTSIDSPDSSAISIVPQVIMNSDLNVENNVYVTVDVTARKFLGDVYAQIVKSAFGEFDSITVNGVQIGSIEGSTRGNLIGDIFSENDVKILENGTDGTDATFTGSVFGNVTGQVSDISNHSIDALSDVDITTVAPSNGQTLIWNAASNKFIPGGQGTGTTDDVTFNSLTLESLDVAIIGSPDSTSISVVNSTVFSSDVTVDNNLVVQGNLTVLGTETIISSESLVVSDPIIYFAEGNQANVLDIGFAGRFNDGVYQYTGLIRDASDNIWRLFSNYLPEPEGPLDFTNVTYDDLRVGTLIADQINSQYVYGEIITNLIDSADSSPITITPKLITSTDLEVQGGLSVGTTVLIGESVLAPKFIGDLEGNVTGQVSDISNHALGDLGDVDLITNFPNDLDILTWNASSQKWVSSGLSDQGLFTTSDVTFNSLTASINTSYITAPDSTDIVAANRFVVTNDIVSENNIYSQNDIIATRNVEAEKFVGYLDGTARDIDDTAITNKEFATELDVNLDQVFVYDVSEGELKKTYLSDIVSSGATGFTGSQGVAPESVYYQPDSITTVTGTYVSGNVNSVRTFGDNDFYVVDEAAGVPGYAIEIDYVNVVKFNRVEVALKYEHTSHIINYEIYNYNTSSWDIVGSFTGTSLVFASYVFDVISDVPYISNGEVKTRLYHVTSGVANIAAYIDYAAIVLTTQGPEGPRGYTGSRGDTGFTGSQGGTLFDFSVVGSAYRVTGLPGDFPIINVTRGQLYYFDFSNISSTDPLALRLETGDTSVVPGTEGNDPVSGTSGNLVVYRVPLDAPNFIVYQGTANPSWIGLINVFDQVGYTGSAGFTGSFGFTGSQGDQGYTGSAGLDGYTGSRGDDGTSIKIVGIVPTSNDLPDPYNGDVGDGYIVANTGNLWTWSGSAWTEVGRILGYTGSQGPAGGYTGSKGDPGVAASFTTRAYTGDGSTTEFEITAGNTIQTILVFLNGVNQRPTDDYTVSGSILTFATAPSAGELIIIREMPQAATGYTGSQGNDGLGILDVEIVDDDLVITYQDSTQDNVGRVVGYTGSQGIPGEAAAIGYTGSQGPQGASTEIKGSVATEADLPGNGRTFVFQSPGFYYNIDGISGENPQITLVRGRTYVFNFESVTSTHPIALRIAAGNIVPVPGTTGNDPQNGVFGPGAIVTYVVPLDAQSSIVYQCVNHPTMIGTISIIDETASNDIGDGYIVESTGDLWFWNGTQWNNVGKITGDLGPIGYTGSRGDDGLGILDVEIVDDDLVITYQDSTQENVGRVVGYTGSKGLGLDPWVRITSNYTAESGNRIIADTTGGGFTLTLPPNPSLGSYVVLTDGGDWGVNPLVISAGGASIEGILNDIGLDIGGITLEFLWDGVIWHITATLGTEGAPGVGVPEGGTTGQVLAKASNDDYDTVWVNAATGGGNLGSLVINGSRITTSDSSQIVVDERFKIEQDLTMGGDILPVTDSQFDLGSPSNKWRSLYVSSDTIFINDVPLTVNEGGELLVNGTLPASSVPSITAINDIVLSSPTVGQVLGFTGSVWTNQSVAASQVSRFINLTITGEITPPRIGTFRFYPPESIVITKVYASISAQAQGGAFTFQINKNGVNTGANLSISEGFFTMTPVNTSISVGSSDYLTVDVTGVGSRDLHIKLEYEPAS